MPSDKPLLVVCGATGNQGGSIISHFLSQPDPPYSIRGITRDPSSPKSLALVSKGVEMVAGSFSDPQSLDAAFEGASVIYGVTDFWVFFNNPANKARAKASGQGIGPLSRDNEAQESKNIIDAAAKVTALERFVFSSMPNTKRLSGGKYPHCHHFDGKALAEEYGRTRYPGLWSKTSVIYVGFYMENFLAPVGDGLRPVWNENKDALILTMDANLASAPFPMCSVIDDTGAFVDALLRAPPCGTVIGVNEWLSLQDLVNTIGQVLGKEVLHVGETTESLGFGDADDLDRKLDHEDMFGFCVDFGYDGSKVDKHIVQPSELGVEIKLAPVKEWCEKQDWEAIL